MTAPINKVALKAAGVRYPRHTEILADLSAAGRVGMMLANDELRVMLVSIHVSLQDALRFVTLENVLWAIRLAVEGTRRFGVAKPRVAVAGLNPHAGEDGLFGHEEAEFIAPAVAAACAQGIDASGPWPPDTVFMRARAGEFDVVVAQYHDQGLIPLKYLGLEHGVNITVGLPFIRTSVDHGTAFDIAGLGVADHRSLAYALKVAGEHVEPARSAGTNVRPSRDASMARLSVNLNKIALLRNSRRTGVPDPAAFVAPAREAGARGITLHPRPDERHVRRDDVMRIAAEMASWRPDFELNLEGFPDERFLALVEKVRPEQCTLVPDPPGVLTSDKGWDLDASEVGQVQPAVDRLRRIGCRVILFIDPDPNVPDRAANLGADGIEIYTGAYADDFRRGTHSGLLDRTAETAHRADNRGLIVNAGHDLNLQNIPPLVTAVPMLAEASIGHELTADALVLGFRPAVTEYVSALTVRDRSEG